MIERKIFGKLTGEAFLSSVRVDVRNTENLEAAREHLRHGALLLYFSHFARLDTIVYGKIIRDYLTSLENVVSFVAIKYIDPKRNKVFSPLLESWKEAFGITLLPIVQPQDKDKYPNPNKINMNSLSQAIEFLQKPGNVMGVAPEGTRSTSGQLLKAQDGLELLMRKSEKVLALPLAGVQSRVLPLITKTTVVAGKPFSYSEIKSEQEQNPEYSVSDLAMKRLALLLPEENRGFYR